MTGSWRAGQGGVAVRPSGASSHGTRRPACSKPWIIVRLESTLGCRHAPPALLPSAGPHLSQRCCRRSAHSSLRRRSYTTAEGRARCSAAAAACMACRQGTNGARKRLLTSGNIAARACWWRRRHQPCPASSSCWACRPHLAVARSRLAAGQVEEGVGAAVGHEALKCGWLEQVAAAGWVRSRGMGGRRSTMRALL